MPNITPEEIGALAGRVNQLEATSKTYGLLLRLVLDSLPNRQLIRDQIGVARSRLVPRMESDVVARHIDDILRELLEVPPEDRI